MKKTEKNLKGLESAVAYGLAPNALGFCGPQCGEEMKLAGFFEGKISTGEIRKILTRFEAAYSYLELIAQKNKIIDPFDERVVEAFWIGNELLDVVTAEDIKKMAIQKFSRPGLLSKNEIAKRLENISSGSRPHHSFHVYVFGQ